MHNIFLIGFMGVGKSTIARALTAEVKDGLIEMDETIEAREGMKISEIFAQRGEEAFRDLETGLLQEIAQMDGKVISCGGGAVLRPENVELMKKSGRIIFLTATPKTIFERVRYSTNRPLLNGNMNVEYIASLMEKREGAYRSAADHIVATDGKDRGKIAEEIRALQS